MLTNTILTLIFLTFPELLVMSYCSLKFNGIKILAWWERFALPIILITLLGLMQIKITDAVMQTFFSNVLLFMAIMIPHYTNASDGDFDKIYKYITRGFIFSIVSILAVQTVIVIAYGMIGFNIIVEYGVQYFLVRMPILVLYLILAFNMDKVNVIYSKIKK